MTSFVRWTVLVGSVATLAACGVIHPQAVDKQGLDHKAAMQASSQGSAFNRSLQQGYADFGRWEYDQADYRDTKYNVDKAKMAAAGQDVQPVDPTRRNINPADRQSVTSARERLMSALNRGDTKTRLAGPAGAAQVYYDCWTEQLEEGHQPEHIAYCKRGFDTAMAELERQPTAQAPAPKPAPQPQAARARPYLVFFDWDKDVLNPSAGPTIDEIARNIKQGRPATIHLAGHADKSGPDKYNMSLSERRATTVLGALAQRGIARNQVRLEYYGEARPLVETPDGVREAQNRRVEISFQ